VLGRIPLATKINYINKVEEEKGKEKGGSYAQKNPGGFPGA